MADGDTVMLQIPVDPSLHARLKIGASMIGASSMKQYIIALLEMGTPEFSPDGVSVSFRGENEIGFIQSHLGLNPDPGDDDDE